MNNSKRLWTLTFACLLGGLLVLGVVNGLHPHAQATTPDRSSAVRDVVINEVAWGGTAAKGSDEWIELYNRTLVSVSLAGWRLVDDDNLDVVLSGTIPAQGYYLIERTDDDAVSDVPADWIASFGSGLSNSGEALMLLDHLSNTIDTANLDGGGWPAGSGSPDYYSMERITPVFPDADANWCSNGGVTRNGQDVEGTPLNGTPKAQNSCYQPPIADLTVVKSGPAAATAGDLITYHITLRNVGNAVATAVRVTDTFPSAVSFVTQTGELAFTRVGDALVWDVGDVPTGEQMLITVVGRVTGIISGAVVNRVAAATTASEPVTANNSDSWETKVLPPDLIVVKTGPHAVAAGSLVTYYITLGNVGGAAATAVRLTDTLPSAVSFVAQSSGFPFTQTDGVLVWDVGDVPTDTQILITVTGRVTDVVSAAFTNHVTATTSAAELVTVNNADSWETGLLLPGQADLVVRKSGPAAVTAGDPITYYIALSNAGDAVATAVRVTDTLPADVSLVAQGGGLAFTQADDVLAWDVGDVPTGTQVIITVTGRVSDTAAGVLANHVVAATAANEATAANNVDSWETEVVQAEPPVYPIYLPLILH